MPPSPKSVALIGSHLPRQCGIATFTSDLASAILDNDPDIDCTIVAMNDRREGYEYPDTVKFQISQDKLNEYRLAADFLNLRNPAVISLQHEYGIFGGQRGSFVIELAKEPEKPYFYDPAHGIERTIWRTNGRSSPSYRNSLPAWSS